MTFRSLLSTLGVVSLAAGLTLVGTVPAHAAEIITVCADECDYTTISGAVANAAEGDTINVGAGTYAESVTIDKSLTIVGPNAAISPNSSDPLVANSARAGEAVVTPPAGASNHAFNITTTANAPRTVSVSGFTIDLAGGVEGQRYLNSTGTSALTLTVQNNHFTNGEYAANGNTWITGLNADSSISYVGNRFTNGGLSNGIKVTGYDDSTTTLNLVANVWLDNMYTAANISVSGATTGQISGNWIGNSTVNSTGTDLYDSRQAGFILADNYEDLEITNNTFYNIERMALNFYSNFSGTVSLTHNAIDGYANVAGHGAIRVMETPFDISGITVTNNTFDRPTVGARAVHNAAGVGTLDVSGNWWGQNSGPSEGQIVRTIDGNTSYASWLRFDDTVVHVVEPDVSGETVFTVGDDDVEIVLDTSHATITGTGDYWIEVYEVAASDAPTAGAGFEAGSARFLDISIGTSGTLVVTGPSVVCVDGDEDETLWHFEGGEWKNITNLSLGGVTVPQHPGKICGMVNSFSPFAVASGTGSGLAATGPEESATTIGLAVGGVLLLGGVTALMLRRRFTN